MADADQTKPDADADEAALFADPPSAPVVELQTGQAAASHPKVSPAKPEPATQPAPAKAGGLAALIRRPAWMSFTIAAAVIAVDQLVKFILVDVMYLEGRRPIEILPFFDLRMVWNPGVSFGLLRADEGIGRWLLVAFAACVVAGMAYWARRNTQRLTAVALGLIMGGAIGNNFFDRVRWGAVADFLDFSSIRIGPFNFPWVFNIADSAITIGVIILAFEALWPMVTETLDKRRAPAP